VEVLPIAEALVVVGYPIDDPDETELVPDFWPYG
jgi:hypothetical protein